MQGRPTNYMFEDSKLSFHIQCRFLPKKKRKRIKPTSTNQDIKESSIRLGLGPRGLSYTPFETSEGMKTSEKSKVTSLQQDSKCTSKDVGRNSHQITRTPVDSKSLKVTMRLINCDKNQNNVELCKSSNQLCTPYKLTEGN